MSVFFLFLFDYLLSRFRFIDTCAFSVVNLDL